MNRKILLLSLFTVLGLAGFEGGGWAETPTTQPTVVPAPETVPATTAPETVPAADTALPPVVIPPPPPRIIEKVIPRIIEKKTPFSWTNPQSLKVLTTALGGGLLVGLILGFLFGKLITKSKETPRE